MPAFRRFRNSTGGLMNAFVTGGAGFIGSHLCEELLARGWTVQVLDDLSTGSIENIEHLKADERFSYCIDDVAASATVAEMVDRSDVVFHLASAVGVKLIVEQPVHTIHTIIDGTERVLECAAKKGKKVVITSTSEVYGKSAKVPFNEEDDMVLGPTSKSRWSYAASKAIDEFLALSFHKEKKLPVCIVRLFNTIGPRQVGQYGMVVPRFIKQALAGGPITVYDDGRQSRCFCYVTDVVDALIKLSECDSAVGRVFNIGSTEEVTIEQLARKVRERVDRSVEITHIPYTEAYEAGFEDMRRRVPDISRAAEAIGFKPRVSLDEALDKLVEYHRAAR